jgi:hypothetical protein
VGNKPGPRQLASTDLGRKYIISYFIKKTLGTGGRQREKPFLDILVLMLVSLLIEKTGNPSYQLIGDFLHEQGLLDIELADETNIRRRYERAVKAVDDVGTAIEYKPLLTDS